VSTKNNKSYKLIEKLPFNINSNNTGILLVLKQNLNKKYFFNSKEILENIYFKYGFDKYNYSYNHGPKESINIYSKFSVFNSFIT
jgi:hypothetical protein